MRHIKADDESFAAVNPREFSRTIAYQVCFFVKVYMYKRQLVEVKSAIKSSLSSDRIVSRR